VTGSSFSPSVILIRVILTSELFIVSDGQRLKLQVQGCVNYCPARIQRHPQRCSNSVMDVVSCYFLMSHVYSRHTELRNRDISGSKDPTALNCIHETSFSFRSTPHWLVTVSAVLLKSKPFLCLASRTDMQYSGTWRL
jgi:hypothetical protein